MLSNRLIGIDYIIRHAISEIKNEDINYSYVMLAFNCVDDYGNVKTETVNFSLSQFMVSALM